MRKINDFVFLWGFFLRLVLEVEEEFGMEVVDESCC